MRKLDEKQKKLVEENHSLIYSFAHSHNLPLDEYYDILAIALCKAGMTFKPELGYAFSTYAYKIMWNAFCQCVRHRSCCGRDKVKLMSLDFNITVKSTGEDCENLYMFLKDPNNVDPYYLENNDYDLSILTERERSMLYDKFIGLKQKEMQEKYGYSQSYISRIIKGACEKLERSGEI